MSDLDAAEVRPHYSAKVFAKKLGVGFELVNGLVASGHIEGFVTTGRSGGPVTFVYRDQVPRFRELTSQMG